MKHALRGIAVALVLTYFIAWAALPFTDAFTAADGTALATYNANWTVVAQTAAVRDNAASCSSGASSCMAKDNSNTYSGNQIGTGIIKTPSGGHYAGIALNVSTGDNGYQCRADDNEFVLLRRGTSSTLWTQSPAPTVLDGDEIRAWRDGNNLYCQLWRSGVMQYNSGAVVETTHMAGSPGIGGFGSGCTTCTRIDDVTLNDYSGGGGSPTRKRAPVPMMFGTILGGK